MTTRRSFKNSYFFVATSSATGDGYCQFIFYFFFGSFRFCAAFGFTGTTASGFAAGLAFEHGLVKGYLRKGDGKGTTQPIAEEEATAISGSAPSLVGGVE